MFFEQSRVSSLAWRLFVLVGGESFLNQFHPGAGVLLVFGIRKICKYFFEIKHKLKDFLFAVSLNPIKLEQLEIKIQFLEIIKSTLLDLNRVTQGASNRKNVSCVPGIVNLHLNYHLVIRKKHLFIEEAMYSYHIVASETKAAIADDLLLQVPRIIRYSQRKLPFADCEFLLHVFTIICYSDCHGLQDLLQTSYFVILGLVLFQLLVCKQKFSNNELFFVSHGFLHAVHIALNSIFDAYLVPSLALVKKASRNVRREFERKGNSILSLVYHFILKCESHKCVVKQVNALLVLLLFWSHNLR